ncbi:MAG: hemerythrin domain-containing protein [Dehalococcoidales bacterium]
MQVTEVLALVEKIIEEHRQITRGFQNLEQVANDAGAMRELDKTQQDFIPGRLVNPQEGLQRWQNSLEKITQGIEAHFNREETALLPVVETYGDKTQVSALRTWLAEHGELRERLAKLKIDVGELYVAETHHVVWHGKAWGIRVYMTHTYNLFEKHARGEQKLLLALKKQLPEKAKGK